MFTGIIQDIGEISAIDKRGDWTLTVIAKKLPLDKINLGASISCSGICLTVIEKQSAQFKVQISAETVDKTTAKKWRQGQRLNLECALRLGDELSGHLLSGHIDGVARITNKRGEGDSQRFEFEIPKAFSKFIAPKGSISLDGVSLTINEALNAHFGINIIQHTQNETTFDVAQVGDEVNFEVDMMARYIVRMLEQRAAL